jgi:hypothetical protein
VEDMNISNSNALADEVKINLNMFGALKMGGVGGEEDSADVVIVDPATGAV